MLKLEALRKDFGRVCAVRDLSLEIPAGSTFALLGPNGAGKTTTMRTIVGIFEPDGGRLTWRGKPLDARARRRFGYLPEERGLYGKMKVREQIVYFGRLHGMTDPLVGQSADRWIDLLGLRDVAGRPCGELSKGNQQKVQVACSAVHDPEVLILDEPFSGLDPVNAEMLVKTIRDLQQRGTTLVLSSHQLWQLEQLCDTFCIISGGTQRRNGSLAELRAEWPTRIIRVEPANDRVSTILQQIDGALPLPSENGALSVRVPAATPLPELLRALVGIEAITRFESVEPSLQDIYLNTIGSEKP